MLGGSDESFTICAVHQTMPAFWQWAKICQAVHTRQIVKAPTQGRNVKVVHIILSHILIKFNMHVTYAIEACN